MTDRTVADLLTTLRSALGRPLDEVADELGYDHEALGQERSYGSLESLSSIHDPSISPATFYADDVVVLGYVGELDASPADLPGPLGEPEARWRSRVGKRWQHHVHAGRGLAFSTTLAETGLAVVEVFTPCTLDDYASTFYLDPGRFVE